MRKRMVDLASLIELPYDINFDWIVIPSEFYTASVIR